MGSESTVSTALKLSEIVTAQMVSGVFDEIVGLLPVVIPAAITYMGIRKGLKFLFGTLRAA